MASPFTTIPDLYDLLCALVESVTGRLTWSKSGIQATPLGRYATVYISQGEGFSYDNVQKIAITPVPVSGPTIREVVWGTTRLNIEVELFRGAAGADATIFKNCLRREARNYDLWKYTGLSGDIRIIDMSAIFRADTEDRFKVMFSVYANVQDPTASADTDINEIIEQTVNTTLDSVVFSTTVHKPV